MPAKRKGLAEVGSCITEDSIDWAEGKGRELTQLSLQREYIQSKFGYHNIRWAVELQSIERGFQLCLKIK